MSYKDIIQSAIDKNVASLRELSDWVHAHPETALMEVETSAYLVDFFKNNGFEVETNLCGLETAFRATKKNGDGRRVCLMQEYDALPGIGHACGHNLIAASCAASALGLAAALDSGLEGEVTVIGSPAEETGEGKPPLVDGGAYDGFDAAMSLHPYHATIYKPNWISIGGMDFHFQGKASHAGSSPSEGVNALDAIVLFYNGFSVLRQQLRDQSRIHGMILSGGTAANIIPDDCTIRLEFRSPDANYYYEIVEKVINCAKGAALATGCELDYHEYEPTCCGVLHNEALVSEFASQMEEFGLKEDDEPTIGSTDVGNVSVMTPTAHPLFKVTDLKCSLHTEDFLNEVVTSEAFDRMVIGSKAMANTLLRVLEDEDFAKSLKAELEV